MAESPNKACVKRHFEELWNHGEAEKIDEFFSPEFCNFGVRYSRTFGEPFSTSSALGAALSRICFSK